MKFICIIQARIASSRLLGKILLPGHNKSLLEHLVERLKKSKQINKIVVATSTNKEDDIIDEFCKTKKITIFRGHPNNLLSRYFNCAKFFKAKNIIRITSDCPLMDYRLVDKLIKKYLTYKEIDYLSNVHPPSFPDGFDIEIFNFKVLKNSFNNAKKKYEKEHVTPYIWDNPKKFKIYNYSISKRKKYYEKYRLTLDYKEDYYLIWNIFKYLYSKYKYFSFNQIIKFLEKNPKFIINKKFIKVNWYGSYVKNLKTIDRSYTRKDKRYLYV
tara:strand:- start:67 stop:876 length:810 start_codon:yes stop_codon:yes gene_type:complete